MTKKYIILFSLFFCFSCKNEKRKNVAGYIKNEKLPIPKDIKTADAGLESEIIKIINAFKQKDEKTLNKYLDTGIGFYLIPGPGTLLHFEKTDSITCANAYLSGHSFGDKEIKSYTTAYEKAPEYNCETSEWNKYGLFIDKSKIVLFTGIVENPQNAANDLSFSKTETDQVKQIEEISTQVYLTEKDGDIVFGIARYNGRYLITFLNLSESYCDI